MLNPKRCILFSGGASGTESFFGSLAEEYGIEEVNFSFQGRFIERTRGIRILTSEELLQKDISLSYISKLMGREYNNTEAFKKVLQSICWQINSGQQVIIVGNIQKDNTVVGGTGWGAEFAKICNKPLIIYDQNHNQWFKWENDSWVLEENPQITYEHFTATGTRFLTDLARQAIQELFEKSFK